MALNINPENDLQCIALVSLLDENGNVKFKQSRSLKLNKFSDNDESGKAILLPVFDPNDPKHTLSPDFQERYEAEIKRAIEQQAIANQISDKPTKPSLDPALLKEMNEVSELLYGPS